MPPAQRERDRERESGMVCLATASYCASVFHSGRERERVRESRPEFGVMDRHVGFPGEVLCRLVPFKSAYEDTTCCCLILHSVALRGVNNDDPND